jgi:ABC-type transporter Mla MlaB component
MRPASRGEAMFRMEIVETSDGITMIIEGRLVSHFAETAKQLIARSKTPAKLRVDISEITYVDSAGETALTWMRLIGAKFVAETSYSLHRCARLHLPRTGKRAGLSPNFVFSGAQAD